MKLINEREQIKSVALRWRGRHGRNVTFNKLAALDPNQATAADVAAIIGDDSWIREWEECDECNSLVKVAVQIGEPPTPNSRTTYVCVSCLEKALALAKGADNGS